MLARFAVVSTARTSGGSPGARPCGAFCLCADVGWVCEIGGPADILTEHDGQRETARIRTDERSFRS